MNTIIVYFHGYGSSPATDKVNTLRQFGEVYAWPINIDPEVSVPFLAENIEALLLDNIFKDVKFVFVGTSLGAYYAQVLGSMFDIDTVLINPSYTPSTSLIRYGVAEEIRCKYDDLHLTKRDSVVVAKDDEIIDHTGHDFSGARSVTWFETGGHRFNGPEFIKAISAHI